MNKKSTSEQAAIRASILMQVKNRGFAIIQRKESGCTYHYTQGLHQLGLPELVFFPPKNGFKSDVSSFISQLVAFLKTVPDDKMIYADRPEIKVELCTGEKVSLMFQFCSSAKIWEKYLPSLPLTHIENLIATDVRIWQIVLKNEKGHYPWSAVDDNPYEQPPCLWTMR
jgi:hypothetical protein